MKVVFKKLVKEEGVKKSDCKEVSLGSLDNIESPPRKKGSLVFFNEKLYKIYKSLDWVYLNESNGVEQHHLELILEDI